MQLLNKMLFLYNHSSHQGFVFLQRYLWKKSRQLTIYNCDFSMGKQTVKTCLSPCTFLKSVGVAVPQGGIFSLSGIRGLGVSQ